MPKASSVASGCFLIPFAAVWITIWSAVTLTFDVVLIGNAAMQLWALGYPTTTGTVIESQVVGESDSEGTSYRPEVSYRYTVARREHTGKSVTYLLTNLGEQDAQRTVARFPVGKQIDVFYNPRNPADALLEPGLNHFHPFMALFLLPFNIIMLGTWLAAWDCIGLGAARRLPRSVKLRRTFDGVAIRVYDVRPLFVAAAAALASSFVGIFVVAFGQIVLPIGLLLALVWLAVIGLTAWACFRQRKQARVVEFNDLRGTLTLHDKGHTLGEMAYGAISVRTNKRVKIDSDGDTNETFGVALVERRKDGSRKRRTLVKGWIQADAERLANWLRERLGQVQASTAEAA